METPSRSELRDQPPPEPSLARRATWRRPSTSGTSPENGCGNTAGSICTVGARERAALLGDPSESRHHRDPFDRLLIAQAIAERLTFVSQDPLIGRYDVDVMWD